MNDLVLETEMVRKFNGFEHQISSFNLLDSENYYLFE